MSDTYQLVRNATVIMHYGGLKLLLDPMLAPKDAYPGFSKSVNIEVRNPMIDMPMSCEEVLEGIDAVVVSHLHIDHWDAEAARVIPKDMKVYVQNEADLKVLQSQGFKNLDIFEEDGTDLGNGVTVHKAPCKHGSDELYAVPEMAKAMGHCAGMVFKHAGSKTIYYITDSLWFSGVEETLIKYKPDYVVLNAGNATMQTYGPIITGKEDAWNILQVLPETMVIAHHFEVINHCLVTRQDMREYIAEKKIADKVLVPEDNDIIVL